MKHKIGMDYTEILATRKDKRDLPFVMRLRKRIDLNKMLEQLQSWLKDSDQDHCFTQDRASSEHNYDLSNRQGVNFVANYQEIYKTYAKIGLQSLTDDATNLASILDRKVDDFNPYERAKGMRHTSSAAYHPLYDERNYTKPTEFYTGYVKELLDSFCDEPCRSAIVTLEPGKFLSPHFDIGPEYVTRLQIPLVTNTQAVMGFRKDKHSWYEYHLPADGSIYFVNSGWEHYAVNNGNSNRYNLRVCLNGQLELEHAETVLPTSIIGHEAFCTRPESGNYFGKNDHNIMATALTELGLDADTYIRYAAAKV
jgi:Aspartyl/Asparaginyl beta-hydroxylase